MKKIVLASNNPVKAVAALSGFQAMFPSEAFELQTVAAPSGVGSQPMTNEETLRGAINRARAARQINPMADYWAGIEGGVEMLGEELSAFAWVVVLDRYRLGKSRTGTFFLPPEVARLIREGKELGEADDIVFKRSNSKQENGAVGILTGDVVDRTRLYEQAVILALAPFKNPEMYPLYGSEPFRAQ